MQGESVVLSGYSGKACRCNASSDSGELRRHTAAPRIVGELPFSIMKLHHVGVVVRDIVSSGQDYARLLGMAPDSEIFFDPIQRVRVQFWRDDRGTLVELIEPHGSDSPVWRESQKGGGLNHLCFETADIDRTISESIAQGAMIAREIAPSTAFGGRRIVFLYFLELGLVEYLETPPD
jgi:methylmalonyl-CoA/ethylmalonyl-CoA epimerase